MTRATAAAVLAALITTAGCAPKTTPDALSVQGNMLTVDNRSASEWKNVEVWLNTYYRVTTPSLSAGARFQAPLDTFVAGFGQRFDYRRAQVTDLRVKATLPDGKPFEVKKRFDAGGIAGALGGLK